MLESIVSSKIRRALLEHLLAHPQERVYLRGLAKQLSLSISPLRRELKRLEQLGLLRAYDEANIRFYVVDPASPVFAQLNAWGQAPSAPVIEPAPQAAAGMPPARPSVPEPWQAGTFRNTPAWQTALGAVGFSLCVAAVLGGVAYLAYTNQRLLMASHETISKTKPALTMSDVSVSAVPGPAGQMRSARWTLVPGTMGAGFSTSTRKESY